MFNVKLLPQDLKEKARLERRKALEDERKKRVFNPKQRMIGVDVQGLRRQIDEKTREREISTVIEKHHHQHQMYAVRAADEAEKKISESKKRFNEELHMFWKTRQRKGDRREHYLNLPVENESDLGVSSGQVFEGEDVNKKNREGMQIEQQKNWLFQQIAEKKQTAEEIKLAEKIYKECLNSREDRALHLDELEKQCRREIHKANMAYNEALAREYYFSNNVKQEKENQDKQMEIFNAINSDLLTENPEVSQSNLGKDKIIQYNYKGMSEEERLQIRQTQLRQIKQNKVNAEAETAYLRKWDEFYKSVDDILVYKAHLQNHCEREYKKKLLEENEMLGREKKMSVRIENEKRASNFSTPTFLNKFNQSSR